MESIKVGALYKNSKKGGIYKVLALAKHSESLEDLVIYEAQYENTMSKVWARPAKMWNEIVEVNGQKVSRFVLVEN